MTGFRVVRIIVLETIIVALLGALIWGIAAEIGFPRAGLVIAIILWLTISPAIEIATVMQFRQSRDGKK